MLNIVQDAPDIKLHSGESELSINSGTGAVEGFRFRGVDLIASPTPGRDLFRLRLRKEGGEFVDYSSGLFLCTTKNTPDQIHIDFQAENIRVSFVVQAVGNTFQWYGRLTHDLEGLIEWIQFPIVVVPGDLSPSPDGGKIFWPTFEGVLVEDASHREASGFGYKPMEYPNHGWFGHYPGCAPMQFMSYMRGGQGLYLGAHDALSSTKEIEYATSPEGVELIFKYFTGGFAAGSHEIPYPMVMQGYEGDWQGAAEIYRDWLVSVPDFLPPKLSNRSDLSDFLAASPVVVIYPVTGEGDHSGVTYPNEYFPFINGVTAVEHLSEAFSSKVLVLLMHWEGTAPWAPPYVWPPLGGEAGLISYVQALHARGHQIGVYCSGLGWTNRADTGDGKYARESELHEQDLLRHMCRGPGGEYASLTCNCEGLRSGLDICAATPFAREVMAAEVMKIVDAGVDYIQLLDQNLGGATYQCYDASHGHPPGPGAWQAQAMNELLADLQSRLDERTSRSVIVGCESAAAECYIEQLPLNDLRFQMGYTAGRPVPAYAYVFHEYTMNFMGNQVSAMYYIDREKSPHNLALRLAYSFIAGDLLSVVLKDNSEVHWAWCTMWNVKAPPQEQVVPFLRHLNKWRQGVGKPFLLFGRMEKILPFEGPQTLPLHLSSGMAGRSLTYSTILSSRWISPDGREAQIFVNYSDREQSISIKTDRPHQVWREPAALSSDAELSPPVFQVPALSAVMVEFLS